MLTRGVNETSGGLQNETQNYDEVLPKIALLAHTLVSQDFDPSGAVVEMRKDLEAAARAKAKKAQEAGNVIEKAKEGEGQENDIKDDEMFWKKLKIIREKPKKRKNPSQGGPPEASKRINRWHINHFRHTADLYPGAQDREHPCSIVICKPGGG